MKKICVWALAVFLVVSTMPLTSIKAASPVPQDPAQTASALSDAASLLPQSDVIAVLDVNRLVNHILPKIKTAWPEQSGNIEKGVGAITNQTGQTGLDFLKIKSVSIGLKLFGEKTTGAMILDGVMITPELMKGRLQDSIATNYKGKTIYLEKPKPEKPATAAKGKAAPVNKSRTAARARAQAKPANKAASQSADKGAIDNVSGLASNVSSSLLKEATAFVQLDAERIAIGDEPEIKQIIDTMAAATPANSSNGDLHKALQETSANGLLRFAVNIPDSARKAAEGEEFLKNLAVTKMVFGVLDISDELSLVLDSKLRTGSNDDATKLHESLAALLGLGKMMLGGNQDPTMQMVNQLLDQIKLSPQAKDVSLGLTVTREMYENLLLGLVESFLKPEQPPAKSDK